MTTKDKTREQMVRLLDRTRRFSSATLRLTNTEVDVDKYVVAAFPAMKLLEKVRWLANCRDGPQVRSRFDRAASEIADVLCCCLHYFGWVQPWAEL
jgi:hypothetical protein